MWGDVVVCVVVGRYDGVDVVDFYCFFEGRYEYVLYCLFWKVVWFNVCFVFRLVMDKVFGCCDYVLFVDVCVCVLKILYCCEVYFFNEVWIFWVYFFYLVEMWVVGEIEDRSENLGYFGCMSFLFDGCENFLD